jgi:hypothetical protein
LQPKYMRISFASRLRSSISFTSARNIPKK